MADMARTASTKRGTRSWRRISCTSMSLQPARTWLRRRTSRLNVNTTHSTSTRPTMARNIVMSDSPFELHPIIHIPGDACPPSVIVGRPGPDMAAHPRSPEI